jgi:FkbM family methyltransferase
MMSGMGRHARNAMTLLRRPTMAIEYAKWAFESTLSRDGPIRTICDVQIGHFNSFSEYHSSALAISPSELAFLDHHTLGEGAVVDVGANLGLFSLVLCRRHPTRRVIAFEPAPSTYDALLKNAHLNAITNLECHRAAVADHDGTARFAVREDARANSSLAGSQDSSGARIEVDCVRLDTFLPAAGVGKIALLKVDVEGFEASVFRGAARVLESVRPAVVYFEVCPKLARREGFAPDEAAAILEDAGYDLRRIAGNGSTVPARRDEIAEVALENWVALPRDRGQVE